MNGGTNRERAAMRGRLISAAIHGRDAEVATLLKSADEIDMNTAKH
jgi:hypothetical protein